MLALLCLTSLQTLANLAKRLFIWRNIHFYGKMLIYSARLPLHEKATPFFTIYRRKQPHFSCCHLEEEAL